MASCWLKTWFNLPGKNPVLPVARIRCEKGSACEGQGKERWGQAWALHPAPGPRVLSPLRQPSLEGSKTIIWLS